MLDVVMDLRVNNAARIVFFNLIRQLNELHAHFVRRLIKRRRNFIRRIIAIQHLEEAEINIIFQHILRGAGNNIVNFPHNRRPRRPNKVRCNQFWEVIVQNHFDDSDWVANFRMRKATFQQLCERLRPDLEPSDLSLQIPLTVEKKVAVTIYKMASCSEYRIVANQFGISKSTVHTAFYAVVNAINHLLVPEVITMPTPAAAQEIVDAYEAKYKFPQVLGAIDGTHIPILPPSVGYRDYVNRKNWPSVILQAVVDHRFRFRNISCKSPGSCHDARVLRGSSIFENADTIIPNVTRVIGDVAVPLLILGDPAYPLLPWLIKGYTRHHMLTEEEESFNVYMSSARMSVEIAFGRLKSRWRCLLKRIDISHRFVPRVVAAACVLHNIVEDNKEMFLEQWLEDVHQAEIDFPQPAHQHVRGNVANDGMAAIRDCIKDHLAANYPLRQGTL